ncbi:MAG: VWA domain-containing protein, partial [Anaerolineae bacterium]|nr:VWA domain-containing protein [Anaerolineae bacterium]
MKTVHVRRFSLLRVVLVLFMLLVSSTEIVSAQDPPAFESLATATAGSDTTSLTINKPSGTTEGDLLIAILSTDGNETLSPPSGWTEIDRGTAQGNAATLGVWYKVAGVSEPGFYTFTWSRAEQAVGAILRYSGADTGDPINASAHNTGNNDSPRAPSITTTVDNARILRIYGADDDDLYFAPYPPGYTGRFNEKSSTDNWWHSTATSAGAADTLQLSHGSTGTADFELWDYEQWRTVTVAIKPIQDPAGIHITKTADQTSVEQGETVTYTYEVTNETGEGDLTNVTVTDDKCSPVSVPVKSGGDQDAVLEDGETWTYTCAYVTTAADFTAGSVTNVATAEGTTPSSNQVQATATATVVVTEPDNNPDLEAACGLDVILVLDESLSIGGAVSDVRSGALALLNALADTGSQVAVVEFSTSASTPIPYTEVSSGPDGTISEIFEPYVNNTGGGPGYNPNGYTNWDAALLEVEDINTAGPVAPLVVFFTDGVPNRWIDDTYGTVQGSGTGASQEALDEAAATANIVKAQGSHIFVVGLGDVTETNLSVISGPDEYPSPEEDFDKADYTLVDFESLEATLRQVAFNLCAPSLTVTKWADGGDGQGYVPAAGWEFTGIVEVTESGEALDDYDWMSPVEGSADAPDNLGTTQSGTTGANGTFLWQWSPGSVTDPQLWNSEIEIGETMQSGYQFVEAVCERKTLDPDGDFTSASFTLTGLPDTVEMGPNDIVTCKVYNVTGIIIARKYNDLNGNGQYNLGDPSLEDWEFTANNENKTTGSNGEVAFDGLTVGEQYEVCETLQTGWANSTPLCQMVTAVVGGDTLMEPVLFGNCTDTDQDGVCDVVDDCPEDPDNDADGDGVCGDVDICPGHDDNVDTDGDGIPDGCDTCPN